MVSVPDAVMGRSEFSTASGATLGNKVSCVPSASHTRICTLNALAKRDEGAMVAVRPMLAHLGQVDIGTSASTKCT